MLLLLLLIPPLILINLFHLYTFGASLSETNSGKQNETMRRRCKIPFNCCFMQRLLCNNGRSHSDNNELGSHVQKTLKLDFTFVQKSFPVWPNSYSTTTQTTGQLNEECSIDIQCPANGYCSKTCLCQNGYGPQEVETSDRILVKTCLPQLCTQDNECESIEFYRCEENKCKCLPTHFDPTRAKCYRFGSQQLGLPEETPPGANSTGNQTMAADGDNNKSTILTDLIAATTQRADLFWLLVVLLTLLLLILIIFLLRLICCWKDSKGQMRSRPAAALATICLPCCWTAHKHKEWDPADAKAAPPDGDAFLHDQDGTNRKNSVNQKSFRRKKNLDTEHEDANEFVGNDDDVEDQAFTNQRSSLVNGSGKKLVTKTNDYAVIDFVKQQKSPLANGNNNINNKSKDEQMRINILNSTTATTTANNNHKLSNGHAKQFIPPSSPPKKQQPESFTTAAAAVNNHNPQTKIVISTNSTPV